MLSGPGGSAVDLIESARKFVDEFYKGDAKAGISSCTWGTENYKYTPLPEPIWAKTDCYLRQVDKPLKGPLKCPISGNS